MYVRRIERLSCSLHGLAPLVSNNRFTPYKFVRNIQKRRNINRIEGGVSNINSAYFIYIMRPKIGGPRPPCPPPPGAASYAYGPSAYILLKLSASLLKVFVAKNIRLVRGREWWSSDISTYPNSRMVSLDRNVHYKTCGTLCDSIVYTGLSLSFGVGSFGVTRAVCDKLRGARLIIDAIQRLHVVSIALFPITFYIYTTYTDTSVY